MKGSIVYGLKSYAGGDGSVAIGTNAMVNVKMSNHFKKMLPMFTMVKAMLVH